MTLESSYQNYNLQTCGQRDVLLHKYNDRNHTKLAKRGRGHQQAPEDIQCVVEKCIKCNKVDLEREKILQRAATAIAVTIGHLFDNYRQQLMAK